MTKYILYFFVLFLIISCKKDVNRSVKSISSSEYFSVATDLKNLKNQEKRKLSDSLYEIRGIFSNYDITGYTNQDHIKVGWWKAINRNNKKLCAELEYKLIDNKEFVNQYIIFENEKIDSLNSKFYNHVENKKTIKYNFYLPGNSDRVGSEGKLNYHIYYKNKEQTHLQCRCSRNKNIFTCEFSYPNNLQNKNVIIRGNFWELFQMDNGDLGQNEIYVLDSLKL